MVIKMLLCALDGNQVFLAGEGVSLSDDAAPLTGEFGQGGLRRGAFPVTKHGKAFSCYGKVFIFWPALM